MKRSFAALLFLVPLSGCYTTLHGNQSVSGGVSTTTTASAVSGSEAQVSASAARRENDEDDDR